MGTASWQPKWWTEENGTAWGKVKEAMKRDWEQTKADLHLGGKELNQDVGDTVKQAAGKEPIPGGTTPNDVHTGLDWDDAERPLMYGYGARRQYGAQHAQWNDKLETSLKSDWEAEHAGVGDTFKQQWQDVKDVVRLGYDRARS